MRIQTPLSDANPQEVMILLYVTTNKEDEMEHGETLPFQDGWNMGTRLWAIFASNLYSTKNSCGVQPRAFFFNIFIRKYFLKYNVK